MCFRERVSEDRELRCSTCQGREDAQDVSVLPHPCTTSHRWALAVRIYPHISGIEGCELRQAFQDQQPVYSESTTLSHLQALHCTHVAKTYDILSRLLPVVGARLSRRSFSRCPALTRSSSSFQIWYCLWVVRGRSFHALPSLPCQLTYVATLSTQGSSESETRSLLYSH